MITVRKTDIEGLLVIEPKVFTDTRGYFMETYSTKDFDTILQGIRFVQDNESMSSKGVIRGLHFQKGFKAQSKLIRVIKGKVLDVAVDIRKGSPTFGKYFSVELSEENKRMLFIPRGFAHGFAVLSDEAVFQYKCDNLYCPESEATIRWNDPEIGIDWKLDGETVTTSPKDAAAPLLKDCEGLFDYGTDYYGKDTCDRG